MILVWGEQHRAPLATALCKTASAELENPTGTPAGNLSRCNAESQSHNTCTSNGSAHAVSCKAVVHLVVAVRKEKISRIESLCCQENLSFARSLSVKQCHKFYHSSSLQPRQLPLAQTVLVQKTRASYGMSAQHPSHHWCRHQCYCSSHFLMLVRCGKVAQRQDQVCWSFWLRLNNVYVTCMLGCTGQSGSLCPNTNLGPKSWQLFQPEKNS